MNWGLQSYLCSLSSTTYTVDALKINGKLQFSVMVGFYCRLQMEVQEVVQPTQLLEQPHGEAQLLGVKPTVQEDHPPQP